MKILGKIFFCHARGSKYFPVNTFCRSLHSSDDSSNYITVSHESLQSLEYKVEGTRLDLYKNKEVGLD